MKKPIKTPEIFVLRLLQNGAMTVSEIIKGLSDITDDKIHSGAVWTTINRLTEQGLLSFTEIGETSTVKQYSITDDGKEYISRYINALNKLAA
jgi:DNA-binding PadR family transcriptional regulator